MSEHSMPAVSERPWRGELGFRIMMPAHWVVLEASDLRRWKNQHEERISGELSDTFVLLETAAGLLERSETIFSAFLAPRENPDSVATISTVLLDVPDVEMELDLLDRVKATPPMDIVEGNYDARKVKHPAGKCVRTLSLRRNVMEVPTVSQASLCVEYFIQPSGYNAIFATTFTTPSVFRQATFEELFDLIASTISFTAPPADSPVESTD